MLRPDRIRLVALGPTGLYVMGVLYLLLSLAVGGDWPGLPTSSTHFPAVMAIDSVTVRG